MQVNRKRVVSIGYTLRGEDGEIIDASETGEPFEYLHGASNIVPGLESALDGKSPGDSVKVSVSPEDGYGEHHDGLVLTVPKGRFGESESLESGMRFRAETPEGARIFTVVEVGDDEVKIDGNHPLAGRTLHFDVEIVDVRDATEDEIAHGHPHGPGGHDH